MNDIIPKSLEDAMQEILDLEISGDSKDAS
jgi:hypothetical protein